MDCTFVSVIEDWRLDFQKRLSEELVDIYKEGYEVVDIKYSTCIATDSDTVIHSAIVIHR